MTTIARTPETVRIKRRWLSIRFSLRTLFLLITLLPIGSAVWWRRPVTVVLLLLWKHHGFSDSPFGGVKMFWNYVHKNIQSY